MENSRMMTPKDPKNSAKNSAESHAKPDVTPAAKPRAKQSRAKDISASHQVAVAKTMKQQSSKSPQQSTTIAANAETVSSEPLVAKLPTNSAASLCVGDYAHGLIQQHFQRMLGERTGVMDDRRPEAVHQMRVHGRRLRATIDLFGPALKIPKQGHLKSLQRVHRTLGKLRNLDVVTARLQQDYYPALPESEQPVLDRCFKKLTKQRRRALENVQVAIAAPTFELAYVDWLKHPEYHQLAAQTLTHVLPQLLLPDLTVFLAHPGWAIAAADAAATNPAVLHDLRKVCKHQRYQLEAVSRIYGAAVETWIGGLKAIQDCLGALQDLAVLAAMVPDAIALPQITALLQQQQQAALSHWDELRQPYGQPQFHYQCYASILQVITV